MHWKRFNGPFNLRALVEARKLNRCEAAYAACFAVFLKHELGSLGYITTGPCSIWHVQSIYV